MWNTKAEGLHSSVLLTHVGITQDDIARGANANALRSVVNAVKGWFAMRRARHELSQLNDHMLADIGLTRYEIQNVAGGDSFSLGALFAPLGELARNAAEILKGWNHRRNAYRQLTQMDDRMLADIGLTRNEIKNAVGGASFSLGALFAPLGELARNAAGILKDWNHRHNAYRKLIQMDDHMLADIGLTRHEIETAFRGKVSKPTLKAAISVDTLRSQALPSVATNQDEVSRAA